MSVSSSFFASVMASSTTPSQAHSRLEQPADVLMPSRLNAAERRQVWDWLHAGSRFDELSLREFAAFIAGYPSLARALVRRVTSVSSGLSFRDPSVTQAVALLGIETSRRVVLRFLDPASQNGDSAIGDRSRAA